MAGFITAPYRIAPNAPTTPRVIPPNPLYVNPATGSDANTGTIDHPLASLDLARALTQGLDGFTIRVGGTSEAAPIRAELTFESTSAVEVEGIDHTPWHMVASEIVTGWAGSGPVYSKAIGATTVAAVIVKTLTETIGGIGFYYKLRPNTATPTTPASGEFGYTAGTLYVRLPDDSNPAGHTIEAGRRNTCITAKGFGMVTIRDIDARYALVSPILNGDSTKPLGCGNLTVEDSFVGYSAVHTGLGVAAAGQTELTICTRVTAHRAGNDGFNLHTTSGAALMILNDCDGSYNGDVAGDSAQGASNHETTHLVINGGTFDYNVSGGMVVIDTATCDLHGDTEHGPVVMDHNMRLGNTAGTIAGQASCAWLNSSGGAVTGPVTVSNGQGVGVRVATHDAVTGLSNITRAGNALADVIA